MQKVEAPIDSGDADAFAPQTPDSLQKFFVRNNFFLDHIYTVPIMPLQPFCFPQYDRSRPLCGACLSQELSSLRGPGTDAWSREEPGQNLLSPYIEPGLPATTAIARRVQKTFHLLVCDNANCTDTPF